jgi:tetratricopeptide (TPR) repeat protein
MAAIGGCARARPAAPAVDVLSTQSPGRLFALGQAARLQGDLARAEQYIVAALERGYPVRPGLRALLAVCVAGDRLETALHHGRRYLVANPGDWALRYVVASLHSALGEYVPARREIERVLRDRPEEPAVHYLRAIIARDGFRDRAGARSALEQYLRLAPGGQRAAEARRMLAELDTSWEWTTPADPP